MSPVEKSGDVPPVFRLAVLNHIDNLFALIQSVGKGRVVASRGVHAHRVKHGCLACAVLAGKQGYAVKALYRQVLDAAKALDCQVGQMQVFRVGMVFRVSEHRAAFALNGRVSLNSSIRVVTTRRYARLRRVH